MVNIFDLLRKDHLLPVDKTRRAALDPPVELQSLREVMVEKEREHLHEPPAVMTGPPRFGEPAAPPMVPSGTSHAIPPVFRFTATNEPNGGGVHGSPVGPMISRRRMT